MALLLSAMSNPHSSPSDEDLFRALKTGDQGALAVLYDRHSRMVYGLGLKILKSPQEAEDLTQEIFLSLWKNAARNPDCRRCLSYLAILTRSRAIDKLRKRGRQHDLVNRWGRAESTLNTPHPMEQALSGERSEHVRQALAQLPDVQRQIIELAYDQGLSQSQIAQQLNLPLGTVKTHTRQGFLKMRRLLAPILSPTYEPSH